MRHSGEYRLFLKIDMCITIISKIILCKTNKSTTSSLNVWHAYGDDSVWKHGFMQFANRRILFDLHFKQCFKIIGTVDVERERVQQQEYLLESLVMHWAEYTCNFYLLVMVHFERDELMPGLL